MLLFPSLSENLILTFEMEKFVSPGAKMSTCGESLMEREIRWKFGKRILGTVCLFIEWTDVQDLQYKFTDNYALFWMHDSMWWFRKLWKYNFKLSPCDGRKADKMAAMRKRIWYDWRTFHVQIKQWKMDFKLPFSTEDVYTKVRPKIIISQLLRSVIRGSKILTKFSFPQLVFVPFCFQMLEEHFAHAGCGPSLAPPAHEPNFSEVKSPSRQIQCVSCCHLWNV